jgi:hypothetical protein
MSYLLLFPAGYCASAEPAGFLATLLYLPSRSTFEATRATRLLVTFLALLFRPAPAIAASLPTSS